MSQGYIRKLESFNLTCTIYLDVLFLLLLVTGIILISSLSRGKKFKKEKNKKKKEKKTPNHTTPKLAAV